MATRSRRSMSAAAPCRCSRAPYFCQRQPERTAMTTTVNYPELESRVMFQTGRRAPVTIVRGDGTRVWDSEGKEYLDFVAGIAVVSLGHSHPVLVDAIKQQAEELIHISNLFYTVPQLQLAELLVRVSSLDRVYFQNSGSEALEACIKLARKWGHEKKDGAYEIISAIGGFHGRTLAAVNASGTPRYKEPFGPQLPGFINVP